MNVCAFKKIKQLSLHYFESFYDENNVFLNSSYTIFDMNDDFIDMLMKCEEIIPQEKNQFVNRITYLKKENEHGARNIRAPK